MSKEYRYNPAPEVWDGHVIVDVPDYEKKMSYRAELSALAEDRHKLVAKARELSLVHVKECALVHKETGLKFTDLREIDEYAEAEDVYSGLGICISKGPKLGNVLRTPSE